MLWPIHSNPQTSIQDKGWFRKSSAYARLKLVVLNHIQNPMSLHIPGTLNWNRFHWEEQGIGDVILQDVCNTTGTPVIHGGTHTTWNTCNNLTKAEQQHVTTGLYTAERFWCPLSLFLHLIYLYSCIYIYMYMLNKNFDFQKNSWEMLRPITSKKAVFIWKLGRDSLNLYLPLSWVLASLLAIPTFGTFPTFGTKFATESHSPAMKGNHRSLGGANIVGISGSPSPNATAPRNEAWKKSLIKGQWWLRTHMIRSYSIS